MQHVLRCWGREPKVRLHLACLHHSKEAGEDLVPRGRGREMADWQESEGSQGQGKGSPLMLLHKRQWRPLCEGVCVTMTDAQFTCFSFLFYFSFLFIFFSLW